MPTCSRSILWPSAAEWEPVASLRNRTRPSPRDEARGAVWPVLLERATRLTYGCRSAGRHCLLLRLVLRVSNARFAH